MVELEAEDFINILRWFEFRFQETLPDNIPLNHKRTFWKLTFLAEDKAKEDKLASTG